MMEAWTRVVVGQVVKKGSDSRHMSQVEQAGFPVGLNAGDERKRNQR